MVLAAAVIYYDRPGWELVFVFMASIGGEPFIEPMLADHTQRHKEQISVKYFFVDSYIFAADLAAD